MVFNVNLSLGAKLARLFVKICGIATHMVVKYLVKYTLAILIKRKRKYLHNSQINPAYINLSFEFILNIS
jgi:hypothetical protein